MAEVTPRFAGKVVLVTGAGGGLGRAFAQGFSKEGAQLILTDVDEQGLRQTAALLCKLGSACWTYRVDLAVEKEILAFGAKVCEKHPRLDVLINNAGIAYGEVTQAFAELSQAKWLRYLAVNAVAPLILAQAVRQPLGSAKGVVINQSSMASYVPATAYGVTKATLNSMTYGMAQTFGSDGIRVNAIAPGLIETPASRNDLPAETYARVQAMQLLKAAGVTDDIVALGLFLASDAARFITCEIISCDGGNRMKGWRG